MIAHRRACPVPITIVVPQPCGSSLAERLCDPEAAILIT
jgi:hypothetical protein